MIYCHRRRTTLNTKNTRKNCWGSTTRPNKGWVSWKCHNSKVLQSGDKLDVLMGCALRIGRARFCYDSDEKCWTLLDVWVSGFRSSGGFKSAIATWLSNLGDSSYIERRKLFTVARRFSLVTMISFNWSSMLCNMWLIDIMLAWEKYVFFLKFH